MFIEGQAQVQSVSRSGFVNTVFAYFGGALALTAVGVYLGYSFAMINPALFTNPILFYGAVIAELILIFTSSRWQGIRPWGILLFALFALLTGYTMAPLLTYVAATQGLPMIAKALFSATAMFAGAAIFGFITKKDLSSMGGMLMVTLIGLIIATIVNLFLRSTLFEIIISLGGVLIFSAFTAYDMQMIRSHYADNMAIYAAIGLYLNFINLFQSILSFLLATSRD